MRNIRLVALCASKTSAAFSCQPATLWNHTCFHNHDGRIDSGNLTSDSAEVCCGKCAEMKDCQVWTFVSNTELCALFNAVGPSATSYRSETTLCIWSRWRSGAHSITCQANTGCLANTDTAPNTPQTEPSLLAVRRDGWAGAGSFSPTIKDYKATEPGGASPPRSQLCALIHS
jgi:hypothetical protein